MSERVKRGQRERERENRFTFFKIKIPVIEEPYKHYVTCSFICQTSFHHVKKIEGIWINTVTSQTSWWGPSSRINYMYQHFLGCLGHKF